MPKVSGKPRHAAITRSSAVNEDSPKPAAAMRSLSATVSSKRSRANRELSIGNEIAKAGGASLLDLRDSLPPFEEPRSDIEGFVVWITGQGNLHHDRHDTFQVIHAPLSLLIPVALRLVQIHERDWG